MFKVGRGVDRRGMRGSATSMMLGLLATLATVFGMACLCPDGPAVRPVAAVSSAYQTPGDDVRGTGDIRDHVCVSPGHHRCGGKATVDVPATGPGAHPFPPLPPALVDARRPVPPTPVTVRPAPARPPDLHVLQVLLT